VNIDQVNIDHAIIIHLQRGADRILGDLEPAIQIAPQRRLKEEVDEQGQVAAPRRRAQLVADLDKAEIRGMRSAYAIIP